MKKIEKIIKRTGEHTKITTIVHRGSPLHRLEVYAFLAVFGLIFIGSCVTPPQVLDKDRLYLLLFVALPFVAWFTRIITASK